MANNVVIILSRMIGVSYVLGQFFVAHHYILRDALFMRRFAISFSAKTVNRMVLFSTCIAELFLVFDLGKFFFTSAPVELFSFSREPLFVIANAYLVIYWLGVGGTYFVLLYRHAKSAI